MLFRKILLTFSTVSVGWLLIMNVAKAAPRPSSGELLKQAWETDRQQLRSAIVSGFTTTDAWMEKKLINVGNTAQLEFKTAQRQWKRKKPIKNGMRFLRRRWVRGKHYHAIKINRMRRATR